MQLNWLNTQLDKIWPFVDEVINISFFCLSSLGIYMDLDIFDDAILECENVCRQRQNW